MAGHVTSPFKAVTDSNNLKENWVEKCKKSIWLKPEDMCPTITVHHWNYIQCIHHCLQENGCNGLTLNVSGQVKVALRLWCHTVLQHHLCANLLENCAVEETEKREGDKDIPVECNTQHPDQCLKSMQERLFVCNKWMHLDESCSKGTMKP